MTETLSTTLEAAMNAVSSAVIAAVMREVYEVARETDRRGEPLEPLLIAMLYELAGRIQREGLCLSR